MDLILYNGKIRTMDRMKPEASAVAVKGGVIAAVGASKDVLSLKTPETMLADMGGARVVPGFNDSHLHILNYAIMSDQCDLTGSASISEIEARMRRHIEAKRIPKNGWVVGKHWDQEILAERRFPTRDDLDAISSEHPVICIRICFHIACANTKALEMLGFLGGGGENPGNGANLQGGAAIGSEEISTGIFKESAAESLLEALAQPSAVEIGKYLAVAGHELAQNGITSVQSDDFSDAKNYGDVNSAYVELARNGRLLFRACQQRRLPKGCGIDDFLNNRCDLSGAEGFYKLGPVKLMADGSLGARTAYLSKPYNDDPSTKGVAIYSQEELDHLVCRSHEAGQDVAVHCIGDGAAYMAMGSIRKAREMKGFDARHGIVHCQITDAPLLEMFGELGVMAYVQPIFLNVDLHVVESRVGHALASTSYNFKTMADMGVNVSFGTDCPVEGLSPLNNIYSAVTRKDLCGNPPGGFCPSQRMTVGEAVYAYTAGSAYCSREERVKGMISEGYMADMAVLSEDIFEMDPDGIKDAKVNMTVLNGKIVWQR
ncbi:MAG: amidohydrolase [Synergistaceae bacterium]|jgi:predicted amidohydrolase YtcJ|nr:amidohydrolase [Synergistaceae bacterium]